MLRFPDLLCSESLTSLAGGGPAVIGTVSSPSGGTGDTGLYSWLFVDKGRGVLVAQLVLRHSCVADRLPVVVRFPAGPRISLKSGDQPKGRWRRPKKKMFVDKGS